MTSAIPELTRSWCESVARCAAWTGPCLCHLMHSQGQLMLGLRQLMLVLRQLLLDLCYLLRLRTPGHHRHT